VKRPFWCRIGWHRDTYGCTTGERLIPDDPKSPIVMVCETRCGRCGDVIHEKGAL
jgi:hypothetical protein